MSILKCKMCGGELHIEEGSTVCECEYCGTKQTIPRLDSDKKINLYDRAGHFRRNNEYDKAMGIYEQILNEDSADAEAYWSLVLCRYGIEYVEDPASHKRIPTINRTQYTSIYADEDYKSALKYASIDQKVIYEQEARTIDDIQKGILAISSGEDPFDIFICYKETDANGRRTPDSVLANELYYQLVQEGFKVFFSRITLEDKLGQEYEPYIFAALNSARVMVVMGTKPEYFNAVWVKNEWSRYLSLIRSGEKKMLIPAYRDMDPYDLPEEFSHLQAQDMSKLGFMQDLIRGIKKITGKDQPQPEVRQTVQVMDDGMAQTTAPSYNVSALIDRGNMAIEDGEWGKADGFFEEVLNYNARCGEAYLGKLLLKYKVSDVKSLEKYFIQKYGSVEIIKERIEACSEDTERIEKAVSDYTVPGYLEEADIRALYRFERGYMSENVILRNQREKLLSELSEEKLLSRARQYATGNTKTLLDNMISDITAEIDARISEAEKNNRETEELIRNAYNTRLKFADNKAAEMNAEALKKKSEDEQKIERDYQTALAKCEEANKASELWEIYSFFNNMNGYKDSAKLAKEYKAKYDEIKAKEVAEKKALLLEAEEKRKKEAEEEELRESNIAEERALKMEKAQKKANARDMIVFISVFIALFIVVIIIGLLQN